MIHWRKSLRHKQWENKYSQLAKYFFPWKTISLQVILWIMLCLLLLSFPPYTHIWYLCMASPTTVMLMTPKSIFPAHHQICRFLLYLNITAVHNQKLLYIIGNVCLRLSSFESFLNTSSEDAWKLGGCSAGWSVMVLWRCCKPCWAIQVSLWGFWFIFSLKSLTSAVT